jgi:formate C-acetyltransferase
MKDLATTERILRLKRRMLDETRYLSVDQARIITRVYRENENASRMYTRAAALEASLEEMPITADPEELIVGNRTPGVRGGVVFPEAGISWLDREIETLPERDQDRFALRPGDVEIFRKEILPYWRGKTLEDEVERRIGDEIRKVGKVVKINQTDHAQGHICPDVPAWLEMGPRGLLERTEELLGSTEDSAGREFLRSAGATLRGAIAFIRRYAEETAAADPVKEICSKISERPPESFHEAVQSVWFLFVILQMESNASSFSPGRLDQHLFPYLERDLAAGRITEAEALELVESLWLKFNQIVYMRNSDSARYFAGFPIGFNVVVGGRTLEGKDGSNLLSYLCLTAQEHLGLPQPNLSARLYEGSPEEFLDACTRVIGRGSGMPQIFNDESIIPSLEARGIDRRDAADYAVVGCVELTTGGNYLGWSDAAMVNMVKGLELALNNGRSLLTGEALGPDTGGLEDFETFSEVEESFRRQIDYFVERMFPLCEEVEKLHAELLPSPFLSSLVGDCLERRIDVTAGGARYNLSGIQAIQPANVADSLAALKTLVYEEGRIDRRLLAEALRENFSGNEVVRQTLLNGASKYGNDVEWVDRLAAGWLEYLAGKLEGRKNYRGGPYHMGLYTVSAHVPMGKNVGATPDGRFAEKPLADGGVSAVYGRDVSGPTALLKSVARLPFREASNGTLLNMKFLPRFFEREADRKKFSSLLKAFVKLGIHHVQFNVLREEELRNAQQSPEDYRGLTVRVAGYTAYFTELAVDLQNEIIERTSYG